MSQYVTKRLVIVLFIFYLFYFLGDGSVCSTTSSNDNGGDVDAFLLQVITFFFQSLIFIISII